MDSGKFRQRLREYRESQNKAYNNSYYRLFGLHNKDFDSLEITGWASDKNQNKLIMTRNNQNKEKALLYSNRNNETYYLNSGNTYEEVVKNTFGRGTSYEVIDDNLFIYNKKNQALKNYSQLNEFHNREKEVQYESSIQQARKNRLTDTSQLKEQTKEDLALGLGMTATALKGDINITDIDRVTETESMVTLENEINGRSEHFIDNFKSNFVEKVKDQLESSPSVRVGFEEFKNASMQIGIGFTELFGAKYDEDTLENDPKVVASEKGYSISTFDKDGNRNDLSKANTFEEAVALSKQMKMNRDLQADNSLSLEQELEQSKK